MFLPDEQRAILQTLIVSHTRPVIESAIAHLRTQAAAATIAASKLTELATKLHDMAEGLERVVADTFSAREKETRS